MNPQPKKNVPIISRYPPCIRLVTLRPSPVFHAPKARAAKQTATGTTVVRHACLPAPVAAMSNSLKSTR